MAHYQVDPDHSTVTVTPRPRLADGPGPRVVAVSGEVEINTDTDAVTGSILVTLAGEPDVTTVVPVVAARADLVDGPDGRQVLRGGCSMPAGAFARHGPPLINPTLLLRWRLVLDQPPDEEILDSPSK